MRVQKALLPTILALGGSVACHRAPSPPSSAEVDVQVLMKQWDILPHLIRVKQGTSVHLHVTTADVQHGFDVRGLNISEPVNPGRTTDITFKADTPGSYAVECGILCGKGHDDMEATIVVEK